MAHLGGRRVPKTVSPVRRANSWVLLALFGAALSSHPLGADDRQPTPPRVFFPEPDRDPTSRDEIAALIDGSFADVNKAPAAREALVRRFGLWSVRPLLDRIEKDTNVTVAWNAILTIGSLRRVLGPSQHLWPAIPVLTKVLTTPGGEPYRRVFAALALGAFYGPDLARVGPASREGTQRGMVQARDALAKGQDALKESLSDADWPTQTAATLALGKIGGSEAASRLRAFLAGKGTGAPGLAHLEPRVARLLATGLLQSDDEGAFVAAAKDDDTRLRAGAALAMSIWAIGQTFGDGTELPVRAASRAAEYDSVLDPIRNTAIKDGRDGAEAIFARGALTGLHKRSDVWNAIYAVASTPSTGGQTAIAATQALLFSPPQTAARSQLAELIGRPASGLQREAAVVAGFLVIAGHDGTPTGIHACGEFLGNKGRDPRGRVEWDVRYHAIIGLCRALESGRIDKAARIEAVRALAEARKSLVAGDIGSRSFKTTFDEVLPRSAIESLAADPEQRLSAKVSERLSAAFVDPDAMTADDPIDVVLDRLNDQVWILFGLDGVKPAAGVAAAGGPRQPNKEDEPQRFLMGWLSRDPYFTRIDLHRERGVTPPPPPLSRDLTTEIDK